MENSSIFYLICHIFIFFWNSPFLIKFYEFIVVGTLSEWYYNSNNNTKKVVGLIIKYHLGSIAMASLCSIYKTIIFTPVKIFYYLFIYPFFRIFNFCIDIKGCLDSIDDIFMSRLTS